MSPGERKDFETLYDLFSHEGWKILINDWEQHAKQVESIRGLDEVQLRKNQGKLELLENMMNLKDFVDQILTEPDDLDSDDYADL